MKYFFMILLAMLSFQVTTITALPIQKRVITVYGNCGSCKKAIEKAAKSVDGVESANWDKKKKTLTIAYEDTKTSLNLIEKAITVIGYDTEKLSADDTAYENLHSCCKYDRKPR
ncbi:MAG: heavy-metal-associated domain-containing protein [Ignavibacteria bacterium]|nr:heavy-metal-associated domain-containing protein [Ignavibacteria bacterium]MBM4174355.1 heavy-metal-associated domain-containing protein [Ignavibacteria bacterium]